VNASTPCDVFRVACLLGLALGVLVGCDDQDSAGDRGAAVEQDAATVDAGSRDRTSAPLDAGDSKAPPADDPGRVAAADDPPGASTADGTAAVPQSSHPIDQTPPGRAYRLALRALDNGDRETAAAIRQRLEGHPQYGVLARAIEANVLAQQGARETALRQAEAISRVPVMRAEAYVIAGRVFHEDGNWTQAIGAYRDALESHPNNVRAHRWLGVIYHDAGAMRLAVEHLRKVAALDPKDFRSLRLAGLIHHDYQNFEEAVVDYYAVLARQPPAGMETEVRVELADSLRELRRIDEALELLAACDDDAAVLTARAACWEAQGELAEAEAAAQQAVKEAPEDPEALFVYGRILLLQREFAAAIEVLQRAVEADPSDHEPRFLLGRALLQSGRTEEGQAELARSKELKQIFLEMAELHLEAIEQPQDAGVRLQLAEHAEQLGRPQIARGWYEAALGLDPGSEVAQAALERLR